MRRRGRGKIDYARDLALVGSGQQWMALAVLLVLLVALPVVLSATRNLNWLRFVNFTVITVIAVIGLNITTGMAGLVSLGHSAFLMVGGYLLAVQLLTMNLAPEKRQIAYVGTANAVTGSLWGTGAIAGGLMVAPLARLPLVGELSPMGSGLPALMLLSAALRVLVLPSLRWIRDVPVRPIEPESRAESPGVDPTPVGS